MHVQFAQSYIDVVMVWEELAARDQGDEIIRSFCTSLDTHLDYFILTPNVTHPQGIRRIGP